MPESLINQGLTLMLAGMGTVFVFLSVLIIAMTLMSMVAARIRSDGDGPSDEELAAITAAITTHRKK